MVESFESVMCPVAFTAVLPKERQTGTQTDTGRGANQKDRGSETRKRHREIHRQKDRDRQRVPGIKKQTGRRAKKSGEGREQAMLECGGPTTKATSQPSWFRGTRERASQCLL